MRVWPDNARFSALNPCRKNLWCLWAVLGLLAGTAGHGGAQVLQTWTQKSLAGNSSTAGESSAAVGLDTNYLFVADNEHEKLRLFARYPATTCPDPVYTFDVRPFLNLTSSNPEGDFEAAAMQDAGGTNRIYWLGSHSNSKNRGALRPNRNRLFATAVSGTGTGTPPYALGFVGRYDHLRDDLIAWDQNNLHGQGANYYGLAASAAAGVSSEAVNGFNLEGFCFAPDGTTAYLGFRVPLVNATGATTATGQRTNALIIPLLNCAELVTNNPVAGPGQARFGTPFTLNLGRRGIRSLDSGYPGHYLITAGPPGDASNPPVAPANFRLFTWTGNPGQPPVERLTSIPGDYAPEGAVLPATPIANDTVIQFVSDDDNACWRSFTMLAGAANVPELQMSAPLTNHTAHLKLLLQPTQTVTVEYSSNLAEWLPLKTVVSTNTTTPFTDTTATNPHRFYRARF